MSLLRYLDPETLLNLKKTFPSVSPHYKGIETIPGMKFAYVSKECYFSEWNVVRSCQSFIYYDVIVLEYDKPQVDGDGNYITDFYDFDGLRVVFRHIRITTDPLNL